MRVAWYPEPPLRRRLLKASDARSLRSALRSDPEPPFPRLAAILAWRDRPRWLRECVPRKRGRRSTFVAEARWPRARSSRWRSGLETPRELHRVAMAPASRRCRRMPAPVRAQRADVRPRGSRSQGRPNVGRSRRLGARLPPRMTLDLARPPSSASDVAGRIESEFLAVNGSRCCPSYGDCFGSAAPPPMARSQGGRKKDNPGKLTERLYIRRSPCPCPDVPGSRGLPGVVRERDASRLGRGGGVIRREL
jgi:hypothetical protein